jgi:ABC-type antimicrobial peptide transport system permease subunit
MRPLTVLTGILLGSCVAITVSLAAVLFVFLVLGEDYPRVQHEFEPLLRSTLIFFGMTIISGASFYSLLVEHPARSWLTALMLTGLAATVFYYIP